MTDTIRQISDIHRDLAQVRAALNDRRVGLFASKRLYAQLGSLLRQIDDLEEQLMIDKAISHVEHARVSVDNVVVTNPPDDWRPGSRRPIGDLDLATTETVQSWTTQTITSSQ
jgi:hypothetical protein